jgi:hypothetical protein
MRKIRAQQIVIDLPTETAPVWVWVSWQRCVKDSNYSTIQVVDQVINTNAALSTFALKTKTVADPITGASVTASGAAVAALIKAFAQEWVMPHLPVGSYINQYQDIIEAEL